MVRSHRSPRKWEKSVTPKADAMLVRRKRGRKRIPIEPSWCESREDQRTFFPGQGGKWEPGDGLGE